MVLRISCGLPCDFEHSMLVNVTLKCQDKWPIRLVSTSIAVSSSGGPEDKKGGVEVVSYDGVGSKSPDMVRIMGSPVQFYCMSFAFLLMPVPVFPGGLPKPAVLFCVYPPTHGCCFRRDLGER
jgi:hypothetical protein